MKEEVAEEVAEGSAQYAEEQKADLTNLRESIQKEILKKLDELEGPGVRAHIRASHVSGLRMVQP